MRALVIAVALVAATDARAAPAAGEYAKHFDALGKLSVAVAGAMPAAQWNFKPHPDSMTYGELMQHIAVTNYQFCAGLEDTQPPSLPKAIDRDATIKLLDASFAYCATAIAGASAAQMERVHDSPDGKLPGRELLLAMYIHVAHHRGQAEIYLRDNGIKPPGYRI